MQNLYDYDASMEFVFLNKGLFQKFIQLHPTSSLVHLLQKAQPDTRALPQQKIEAVMKKLMCSIREDRLKEIGRANQGIREYTNWISRTFKVVCDREKIVVNNVERIALIPPWEILKTNEG